MHDKALAKKNFASPFLKQGRAGRKKEHMHCKAFCVTRKRNKT